LRALRGPSPLQAQPARGMLYHETSAVELTVPVSGAGRQSYESWSGQRPSSSMLGQRAGFVFVMQQTYQEGPPVSRTTPQDLQARALRQAARADFVASWLHSACEPDVRFTAGLAAAGSSLVRDTRAASRAAAGTSYVW
jgi:hypothetical protein